MTDQVFSDLPQTPPPEPPADALAQKEPSEALTPAQEMAGALSAPEPETPDDGDGDNLAALIEQLGHTDFLADNAFNHFLFLL